MPIYEYRRPDGSTFEVIQSFRDDPLTHDPQTGVEVTRVLHAPAVHFKGSGFYNTDYGTRRRQREAASSDSSGDGGGGSQSKDGASSESASKNGDSGSTKAAGKDAPSKAKGKTEKAAGAAKS